MEQNKVKHVLQKINLFWGKFVITYKDIEDEGGTRDFLGNP